MLEATEKAHTDVTDEADAAVDALIRQVGLRVRQLRSETGMARRELSERSGVSPRYLAQLEGGEGNISIGLLQRVALALGTSVEALLQSGEPQAVEAATVSKLFQSADAATRAKVLRILDPDRLREQKAQRICLVGLRGAGKSTLGAGVAADLNLPFVELNKHIEATAGMPIAEIIALYGQEGYRDIEADALREIIESRDRLILAVGGGIVSERDTFNNLLMRFHTVWIKAAPSDHMERVRAQGDLRPMAGNPQAMIQLRQILKNRQTAYAQAEHALDTSGKDVETSRAELRDLIVTHRIVDPA